MLDITHPALRYSRSQVAIKARPKLSSVNANTLHIHHPTAASMRNMQCLPNNLVIIMRQRIRVRLSSRMYNNIIPMTRHRNDMSNCSYLSVPLAMLLPPRSVVV
ncbi:hypothetical protein P3342_007946 [Pyrenophora teres f. teres]|nr:hypothetical protein P3342_007946 [Pyrenophora teres f. teres]